MAQEQSVPCMSRRVGRVQLYRMSESRLSLVPLPLVLLSNRSQHGVRFRQRFVKGNCLSCKLYGFRIAKLRCDVIVSAHNEVDVCESRISERKSRVFLDCQFKLFESFPVLQHSPVPDISPLEVMSVGF